MNKYIKAQLGKIRQAAVPQFDDETTHLVIRRTTDAAVDSSESAGRAITAMLEGFSGAVGNELVENHCYRISIDTSLVNPDNKWYATIHNSWNGGVGPQECLMKCQVLKFNNSRKMVAIYCQGEVAGTIWTGWVPVANIKVIEELHV